MKYKAIVSATALLTMAFLTGCSSHRSQYGNTEVVILGGLLRYEEDVYLRQGPLTMPLDSSEFFPPSDLDGDSVSLLWGLITYVDE